MKKRGRRQRRGSICGWHKDGDRRDEVKRGIVADF